MVRAAGAKEQLLFFRPQVAPQELLRVDVRARLEAAREPLQSEEDRMSVAQTRAAVPRKVPGSPGAGIVGVDQFVRVAMEWLT